MMMMEHKRSLAFLGAACFFAVLGLAQEETLSPFETPRNDPQPQAEQISQPSPLDTFEFNGIMRIGGELRISVYDTKENRNYWLTQNAKNAAGLEWMRYDEKRRTVLIARGGMTKELTLKKVQIEPLKIASSESEPPPPPNPTVTTGNNQPAVAQESDEEIRKRMQRVAEEIRRRRAERRARIEERREGGN